MRRASFFLLLLLTGCGRTVAPLPPAPVADPTPQPAVQFPRDAEPHDVLTEWWYYTGHLYTSSGREFGFEFTIFQVRRQAAPTGYLAHFAISDVAAQRFSHQARASQGAPDEALPLRVADWSLSEESTIEATMQPGPGAEVPFALHLETRDLKPPALHHGGYIDPGPAGGSYYYSRTRLAVQGELREGDGPAVPVEGQAWMDHQWGNFIVARGGWDWYSLQLDDQTELMLYVLRFEGQPPAVFGSHILADGRVIELPPDAVRSVPLGSWTSPHTGAVYPSGWDMTLETGARLQLRPLVQDQELYFPGSGGLAYWEGAVSIDGDRHGRGYVELTGYATP
jgi:predicted secreted hydrolase